MRVSTATINLEEFLLVNRHEFSQSFQLSNFFSTLFFQSNEVEKHLSSSIEDLKLLFQAEKEFVETLKRNHTLFINDAKFAYLEAVDFKPNEAAEYVYHPINAFHMLLRLL